MKIRLMERYMEVYEYLDIGLGTSIPMRKLEHVVFRTFVLFLFSLRGSRAN